MDIATYIGGCILMAMGCFIVGAFFLVLTMGVPEKEVEKTGVTIIVIGISFWLASIIMGKLFL